MTPSLFREPLVADFTAFAGWRLAGALGLVVLGAALEGAGILLLVPIVGLSLGGLAGGRVATYADPVFEAVGAESGEARLLFLLAVFAVLVVVRFVVHLRRDVVLQELTEDFSLDLRARAFRSLAAKPWAELARLHHGPVGHALTRDVDRAADGVQVIIGGMTAALIMVVQLALAFTLSPLITVVAIVFGALGFRLLRWLRLRAQHLGQELTSDDLALYSSTQQFLGGLKPARAHRMEPAYIRAFEKALARRREQNLRWMIDRAMSRLLLQSGAAAVAALAIIAGVFWLDLSTEILIVTVLILARAYGPVLALQHLWQGVRHSAAGYRVARALAEEAPTCSAGLAAQRPEPLTQAPDIAFDRVTVRSDEAGARPILDRVSCRIPAGGVTALVGASGAGKSTLSDLAIGLLAPDEGQVLLDGRPLDEPLAARLGSSLAYVGQEGFMLTRTLRENLAWGSGAQSDKALLEALELVGARHLADQLEGGLDGWVRADGTRFSGGERQRLRLARAWLRRPRMIVLDEATNALDPENEHRLLDHLLPVRGDATVLMITHRPATALRADHLILLDEGRVVETGPSDQVARQTGGAFAALFARALAG